MDWGEMKDFVLNQKLSIEREYGSLLMDLIEKKRPKVVIEIGTGQGYSTSWILKGLNKNNFGKVFTFDSVNREPYVWEIEEIPSSRLRRFNCEFKNAGKLLPDKIDFVFHDAGHWIEHVMSDLDPLFSKITVGGMVLVHDIVYSNDMGEKLKDFFSSRLDWKYEEKRDGCGMGIAERLK